MNNNPKTFTILKKEKKESDEVIKSAIIAASCILDAIVNYENRNNNISNTITNDLDQIYSIEYLNTKLLDTDLLIELLQNSAINFINNYFNKQINNYSYRNDNYQAIINDFQLINKNINTEV